MKRKEVKVDLSSKRLESLDEQQLTKFNVGADATSLKLQHNSLKDLPWALIASKAPLLRILKLTRNAFSELGDAISLLTSLEELVLSNNHLTVLTPQLGQLTKLKLLQLDHNQLESLPASLGLLTELTTLNVTNNRLLSLPPELHTLTQLKVLELSNNPLLTPPPDLLKFPSRVLAYLKGIYDAQISKLPRYLVHSEQIEASPKIYGISPTKVRHSHLRLLLMKLTLSLAYSNDHLPRHLLVSPPQIVLYDLFKLAPSPRKPTIPGRPIYKF